MRFRSRKEIPTWGRNVDADAAVTLLHMARELGVNYFDTAYNYHAGTSERVLGRFLGEIPRDSVLVASKSPVWLMKRPSDFKRYLTIQLTRLRDQRVDFYLLHGLNGASFEKCLGLGAIEFLEAELRRGRIGSAGFSFHDIPSAFAPIVDSFDWGFCQIQYNLVDTEEQAGVAGLDYAVSKGLGVVVMEPLRGGDLVEKLPPEVEEGWRGEPGRTPVQHCLRWIWDHPGVSTVLSGMNTVSQLEDNAETASAAAPGCLSDSERVLLSGMQRIYRGMRRVGCTGCSYCMPCPSGVDIPKVFDIFNESSMFPDSMIPPMAYNSWLKPESRADRCTGCGECERKCPQRLPVMEALRDARTALERRAPGS
jgi:predicted aldo/keto reductase-like oxidoreductase